MFINAWFLQQDGALESSKPAKGVESPGGSGVHPCPGPDSCPSKTIFLLGIHPNCCFLHTDCRRQPFSAAAARHVTPQRHHTGLPQFGHGVWLSVGRGASPGELSLLFHWGGEGIAGHVPDRGTGVGRGRISSRHCSGVLGVLLGKSEVKHFSHTAFLLLIPETPQRRNLLILVNILLNYKD